MTSDWMPDIAHPWTRFALIVVIALSWPSHSGTAVRRRKGNEEEGRRLPWEAATAMGPHRKCVRARRKSQGRGGGAFLL